MRTAIRSALLSVAGALIVGMPLAAQRDTRSVLLVTPQWLALHIHDPNLVLLHVGDKAEYEKAHIPGARYVEYRETHLMLDPLTKLTLQLLPDDTLRVRLAGLGISDDSQVIVYYGKDLVSQTTRVIFTLDFAGVGRATSLLDGGMGGWIRSGNATTADVAPSTLGALSALKTKPLVVTAEFVRDNIGKPGFAVIDARASSFYEGVQEGGPSDARKKGHISGALSVPFSSITSDSLELKSADDLAALFRDAGVKPGDTIIGYCHIGQQATAMLFAARTLGYKVLLYDGSFEDWARRGWSVDVSTKRDK